MEEEKYLDYDGLKYYNDIIQEQITGKQDALVSGTNIKTINNTSLLGSGDITIGDSIGTYLGKFDNYTYSGGTSTSFNISNPITMAYFSWTGSTNNLQLMFIGLLGTQTKINNVVLVITDKTIEKTIVSYYFGNFSAQTYEINITANPVFEDMLTSGHSYMFELYYECPEKEFIRTPRCYSSITENNQLTTKKYVDDSIATAIGTALGGNY